ncbi:hypothetical protein ACI2LF_21300 [Kribbella sp. NPDC020789]
MDAEELGAVSVAESGSVHRDVGEVFNAERFWARQSAQPHLVGVPVADCAAVVELVGALCRRRPAYAADSGRDGQVWAAFLRAEAEKWPPVFGYLADDSFGAGATRTPLEATSARFPEQTLPLAESEVRGYSWVTVTSAGVLERLGGTGSLRGSGAFHDITALPSGGAVLQATSRLAEYEGDAVRQVFEALGPVLPEKAPWPDEFDLFKLIYEAPRR